jgi:hypothetical protein
MDKSKEEDNLGVTLIPDAETAEMEIFIDPDDNSVYVRFSGFIDTDESESYAEYLAENLPFMLYQSPTLH